MTVDGVLDPTSTEIVLRRAFELAEREPRTEVVLERSTLAEIALEVDLPLDALASAVAERQLRLDRDAGLLRSLVGPALVTSRRRSTADEDEMRRRATAWLQQSHGLRPRRQPNGMIVATKRRDLSGRIARSLRDLQGLGQLGRLRRIEIAAVDIGDVPGTVCVVADVADRRAQAVAGGAAVSVGTAAAVGVGAAMVGPVVLAGLPVAAAAGLATSRVLHGTTVRRVRDDLDETLDAITTGADPETSLTRVARAASDFLGRKTRSRTDTDH